MRISGDMNRRPSDSTFGEGRKHDIDRLLKSWLHSSNQTIGTVRLRGAFMMPRSSSNVCAYAAAAAILILSMQAPGQINTGRITGTISDPGGGVVTGVVLRATNEETGVVTSTQSAGAGEYLINFLVPGR